MNQTHFSEIGQRISWTLVHSVWQFALVALLLAITLWFIRGRSPHLRYGLILAAMLGMVLTPPATFLMFSPEIQTSRSQIVGMATGMQSNAGRAVKGSGYPIPNQHVAPPLAADASAVVDLAIVPKAKGYWAKSTTDEFRAAIVAFVNRWMDTILACWLGGILILSIRPLIGWRATCALRSRGRDSVSDSIVMATKRIAERLGVRRAIEVTRSTLVEVPTVIGWLKPLVLLPTSAISGLRSEQLEAVIAHELAHVRRNDYLVNLFQLVMETVFFYHPAVWWVSHRMRVEREECCDDVAVKMTGDRIGYAKLLVWLDEARTQPMTAPLGMSSGGGSLLSRVRRIVSTPAQSTSMGTVALAVMLAGIVGIAAAIAIGANATLAQEAKTQGSDVAEVTVQVADGLTVELLAVMPHLGAASQAWKPDGTSFETTPNLPEVGYNSATLKLSGLDLFFRYVGLTDDQKPIYRMQGVNSMWPPNKDGIASIIVVPKENAKEGAVSIGIPDEEWGPWRNVNRQGELVKSVLIRPKFREAYNTIKINSIDTRDVGVIVRWAHDRDQNALALTEVIAVDNEGVRHRTSGKTNWNDPAGVARSADVFDLAWEDVEHFEYRLRPIRYRIAFEQVALRPNQKTEVTSKVSTVAIPLSDNTSFSGRIVRPDSSPINAGGQMYYLSRNSTSSRQIAAGNFKSSFQFDGPAGEAYITYYTSDFAPAWSPKFDIDPGDLVEGITLTLNEGIHAEIQVKNQDGSPIAGATVIRLPMIYGSAGGPVDQQETDQSGRLELRHFTDVPYRFNVEAAGYEKLRTEPITIESDKPVILTLQQSKPTTGKILNAGGTPAVAAKVRCTFELKAGEANDLFGDGSGDGHFGQVLATTDESGRFKLDSLSQGSRYLCIIEGPNESRLLYRDFQAGQSDVEIRLPDRRDLKIELRGDLSPYFREGDQRYVDVRQSINLKTDSGGANDLAGGRAEITPNPTGGSVVYRGLVVDPQAGDEEQTVQVSFGSKKRGTQRLQLTDQSITSHSIDVGPIEDQSILYPQARTRRMQIHPDGQSALIFYSEDHVHLMLVLEDPLQTGLEYSEYPDIKNQPSIWKFQGKINLLAGEKDSNGKAKIRSSYALLLDYSPPQMSLQIDGQLYDLNQGRVILLGQDGSIVQKLLDLPSADEPDAAFERVIND